MTLKGTVQKYSNYSDVTGITKENQHLTKMSIPAEHHLAALLRESNGKPGLPVSRLASEAIKFSEDRQWTKLDKPTNLVLAVLAETGELAEIVQWVEAGDDTWEESTKWKVKYEVADVAIYLLKLAAVLEIEGAVQEKN